MSIALCPHCGAALPPVRDASCPACRNELPGSAVEQAAGPPAPAAAPPDPRLLALYEFHANLRQLNPRTPVTPVLVAANVLVFVAMAVGGVNVLNPDPQTLVEWGANFGPRATADEWWRLLTSAFVHGGLLHLAFNMLCLAGVGRTVERLVGSTGLLLLYVSSALVASLASVAWSPAVVSVGASGAVFGVFGAFFGACQRAGDTIPRPALELSRQNTLKFLGLNLVVGLAVPNIDMAAHVGGLAWGFACGLILGHPLRADAVRTRLRRNLALLFLTPFMVGVGFAVAKSRVASADDPLSELTRIGEIEQRVLDDYNDAVAASQAGTLTDAELATKVEQDILPPWREARRRFRQIADASEIRREFAGQFGQYLAAREDAWTFLVQGLRDGNEGLLKRSLERWEAADAIAKALAAGNR